MNPTSSTEAMEQKIVDKKLSNHQLFYLVKKGKQKNWKNFQQLKDNMKMIYDFEAKMKNHEEELQKGKKNHQRKVNVGDQSFSEKIQKLRRGKKDSAEGKQQIQNIIFLEQQKGEYIFRVVFKDCSEKLMRNPELRKEYPNELMDFYERNVLVCSEVQTD